MNKPKFSNTELGELFKAVHCHYSTAICGSDAMMCHEQRNAWARLCRLGLAYRPGSGDTLEVTQKGATLLRALIGGGDE